MIMIMIVRISFLASLLLKLLGRVYCYDGGDMAVMYTVEAITTSDCVLPKSAVFDVSCRDGGRIRDLSADEGLGLAACVTNLNDQSTLTCEDSNVDSFLAGSTVSNLVFACEGPTAALREASVVLREDAVDCSGASFGMASYSRSLHVSAVCPPVPGMVVLPMEFDDNQCTRGGEANLIYMCKSGGRCGHAILAQYSDTLDDDGPCGSGMPLESFGLEVTDSASLVGGCLWKPEDLSSGGDNADSILIRSDGGPLAASYEVNLQTLAGESIYGDGCSFDSPSKIQVKCGLGSALVSNDLDDTPLCDRLGREVFDCEVDANAMAELLLGISVSVTCKGSTRGALSLEVNWDPASMECNRAPSWGGELATLSYTMLVWQTCAIMQRDYTRTNAQQCSPITATRYNSLAMHLPDLDPDLNVGGELCSVLRQNCHAGNQCDGANKQELGSLKVRVPPSMVDLSCAEGGDVDLRNDVDGGTAGGGAEPADEPANYDREQGAGDDAGGDVGRVDGGTSTPAGDDAQGILGDGGSDGSRKGVCAPWPVALALIPIWAFARF